MTDVTEFYGIACAIVKGWPATYPNASAPEAISKRPQTFAVLRSLLDIEADNLAKSIEHARPPYMFIRGYDANAMRSGVKIEYPLIGCAEDTFTFFKPTGSPQKQRHKINLFCIDQLPYRENAQTDPYSTARSVEEVGRDLRQMMLRFLNSLKRWGKLEFTSGPYVDGWHDMVWLKAHGEAATWEVTERLTDVLVNMNEVGGDVIYQGSDDNAILITNVFIDTDYCPADLEFTYTYKDGVLIAPPEKWILDI